MKTDKQIIDELLADHEPAVRNAFMAALDTIRSAIILREVIDWLTRGDIDRAVEAMHIEPEAYSRLQLAMDATYTDTGIKTVENLPRRGAVFRFGVRNIEAEQWISNYSSRKVREIAEDQRLAIRQHLTTGLETGRNPRATALDVVGRVNKASGRREGGILGLTSVQERYVTSARQELLAGDEHYFTRTRRDKRFDRSIAKYIREGLPVPATLIDRAVGRYSDRLLQLRGETIARTETLTALGKAREDAIRQQIISGKLDAKDVTKIWHSAFDDRVRHTHRLLNRKKAAMDGTFVTASGASLRFPGDPDGPPREIIGCRCWLEYKVDFFASVVSRYRAERV